MKKHFITGLVILMPLVLTLLVARWVINLLTKPFIGIFQAFLGELSLAQYIPNQLITLISQLFALALFIAFILFIGFLARYYIVHGVVRWAEVLFHRIPIVGKVYKACKEVVDNLFHSEKASFQSVVLVPYPYKGMLAVGLVSRDELVSDKNLISVFVPGTPNPTMGFILLYDRSELLYTDMTVRQALQMLISCGAKIEPYSIIGTYEQYLDFHTPR